MQFIYFDIHSEDLKDGGVIHNVDDPKMSPIIMWNTIIADCTTVNKKIVLCTAKSVSNYEAILKLHYVNDFKIISIEELVSNGQETTDKIELLKLLYSQGYITADPLFICYDTCIPVNGLHLDYIYNYFMYKQAKGVYLYTYDSDIFTSEIGKQMGKSVAPVLLLDIQYVESLNRSNAYTLINIFDKDIFGLWLPYLPLVVQSSSSLQKGIRIFNNQERSLCNNPPSVTSYCQSRIGLIGNPSDGYYGNTISITLDNFRTTVTLVKSQQLQVLPHPISDPLQFKNLSALHQIFQQNGYTGGLRLLYASLNHFYKEMMNKGIYINETPFTIGYDTTIPRQVGLSGSSSIIIATLRSLMKYYSVPLGLFTKLDQIKWALQVETEELKITAGLQDRVIQVLEGCVMMDFDRESIEKTGNGLYTPVDISLLPPMFVAYCTKPKDYSGSFHSNVKQRWLEGDTFITEKMNEYPFDIKIASLPKQFIDSLNERDEVKMKELINRNFDLRREIWGVEALGGEEGMNMKMIQIARKHGMAAKFCGSGGAVVIIPGFSYKEDEIEALREEMNANHFSLEKVRVYEGKN